MTNVFKRHDEEKGALVWRLWFILMVELLGTFAMVFEIIAPNALHLNENAVYDAIFGSFIMKAVWVTGFIWILIMICGKVSVNLNPAVTLSEVAHGQFGMGRASLMIIVQMIGALAAGEVAYQIGNAMNVGADAASGYDWTLDAVFPRVAIPSWWGVTLDPTFAAAWNSHNWNATTDLFKTIPFILIEFTFTYLLILSVFKGNFGFMARSFVICVPLTITVALGIFTHNIALNPARLLGPAIIGQAHSHAAAGHATASSMEYTWVFLLGEMLAILAFAAQCAVENNKEGNTKSAMKKEVRSLASEVLVTRARYEWVLVGNQPLETTNKADIEYAATFCGVEFNKTETRDDIEYDILEWIIFGLESDKKPPLVTKKAVKKAAPVKKAPAKKKPAPKKEEPKISKEEQAKRDAKREAMKAKVAKQMAGKKISAADLKKMKLTDLYGVGPKIEEYYHANGITDMVKLSNLKLESKAKKFVEELPALRSFTPEMKRDKILSNIAEADFMVNELTK